MYSAIQFIREKFYLLKKFVKREKQPSSNSNNLSQFPQLKKSHVMLDDDGALICFQITRRAPSPPPSIILPKIMDPFYILPFEITLYIITLLSQNERVECLQVSRWWHEVILSCAEAWDILLLENDQQDAPLIHSASFLANHVKHLAIDYTTFNFVQFEYLKKIQEGHFKRLQSLRTRVPRVHYYYEKNPLKETLAALWQVGNTLTKLSLDVGDVQNSLTLACILLSCQCLTDLVYTSEEVLSFRAETFQILVNCGHPSLVNLELSSPLIIGNDIKPIVQGCQELQRLVLDHCDISVLDVIVSHSTPNLELFSFNDKIDGPPLPTLQQVDKKITDIGAGHKEIKKQGLRVLYTSYGERNVRSENFIPLLYKHRETLENVRACLSPLSDVQLEGIYAKYPRFKLENLKHLATWLESGIQEFMLHAAIRGATQLSTITAVGDHGLDMLLTTLLDKKPPLFGINLSHVYQSTNNTTQLLIRLFEKYSQESQSSSPCKGNIKSTSLTTTVLSNTIKHLNWVKLRYCESIVTDKVLLSLAGIKTLQDIHLGGLTNISAKGILQMFNILGSQITRVFLHDMYLVNDRIIVALSKLDNLVLVKLELLDEVTDQGIRTLIDIKAKAVQKLVTLEVTECNLISQDCIHYAQKKVKTVRYNSPHSDYYITKAKSNYHVSRSAWLS